MRGSNCNFMESWVDPNMLNTGFCPPKTHSGHNSIRLAISFFLCCAAVDSSFVLCLSKLSASHK